MKLLLKINFLLALTCLFTLGSCSDDDTDPAKSEAEIIGSGIAWKLSTAKVGIFNVISEIDACLQDNEVTFNYETSVKLGVLDAGPTKCSSTESQTVNFIWDYNESTKILLVDTEIIDVPGAEGNMIVESVSNNELVISQNISVSGFTQKLVVTFVH
ncbi:hypothetical protein [Algoriphagus yeomjeoni]|uniref:Lipocalin-like protein n=1 Tax=Algoriphagus yeomjeoni TaxID=291403 RepID=A0A327P419_9BACT|nr:hypothetical protein [Algoriphagus yeomjeoni]RAI87029.1 hypothetical protein LV83_03135 [Algoriphagus yeomjeoni]